MNIIKNAVKANAYINLIISRRAFNMSGLLFSAKIWKKYPSTLFGCTLDLDWPLTRLILPSCLLPQRPLPRKLSESMN